jgi:proteasome lid subunit RPN8/RPN11
VSLGGAELPALLATLTPICERVYPREACGWIADGVREARPGTRDGFAFCDDELIALARGDARALFHSHPDGDADLSARDREALALHPLPHLLVAVAGGRAHAATLFGWRDGAHVAIARFVRTSDGGSDRWSAA